MGALLLLKPSDSLVSNIFNALTEKLIMLIVFPVVLFLSVRSPISSSIRYANAFQGWSRWGSNYYHAPPVEVYVQLVIFMLSFPAQSVSFPSKITLPSVVSLIIVGVPTKESESCVIILQKLFCFICELSRIFRKSWRHSLISLNLSDHSFTWCSNQLCIFITLSFFCFRLFSHFLKWNERKCCRRMRSSWKMVLPMMLFFLLESWCGSGRPIGWTGGRESQAQSARFDLVCTRLKISGQLWN